MGPSHRAPRSANLPFRGRPSPARTGSLVREAHTGRARKKNALFSVVRFRAFLGSVLNVSQPKTATFPRRDEAEDLQRPVAERRFVAAQAGTTFACHLETAVNRLVRVWVKGTKARDGKPWGARVVRPSTMAGLHRCLSLMVWSTQCGMGTPHVLFE